MWFTPPWPIQTHPRTAHRLAGNKVPGSEYDLALLVLDAQAPPYAGSDCSAQCIGMSTARAPDGTTLSSVGQGSAASNSFTAATALQEVGRRIRHVVWQTRLPCKCRCADRVG